MVPECKKKEKRNLQLGGIFFFLLLVPADIGIMLAYSLVVFSLDGHVMRLRLLCQYTV